jgi:hypothetical protein
MNHGIAAAHNCGNHASLAQIAADNLNPVAKQSLRPVWRAAKQPHPRPLCQQF